MGEPASRWALEIVAAAGKCQAYLVYTRHGEQTVIWQHTDWQLPDIPLAEHLILQELIDVALVLLERA